MILGVDVSRFQGTPDFNAAKNAGITVVTVNIGEANNLRDSQVSAARAAGMIVGGYWYLLAGDDPNHAAAVLMSYYQPGDLLPCLDLEDSSIDANMCATAINTLTQVLNADPILYCNRGDYDRFGLANYPNNPLWHAAYPYNNGSWVPAEGQQPNNAAREVAGWQFASNQNIPGIGESDTTVWFTLPTGGQPATTPPASPAQPVNYADGQRDVKKGDVGQDVMDIQAHLGIVVDGDFGNDTDSAVRMFQTNHGLASDGVVGQQTWNALLSPAPTYPPFPGRDLVEGVSGQDVTTWQQQMANRGWSIAVDGQYGSASASICKQFQSEKGLAVDGVVGPQTWTTSWTAAL